MKVSALNALENLSAPMSWRGREFLHGAAAENRFASIRDIEGEAGLRPASSPQDREERE